MPLEEIDLWSKRVVREFAPFLRDVCLYSTCNVYYYHLETTIHVQLSKSEGLRVSGSHGTFCVETQSYEEEPKTFAGLPAHAEALEVRRREGAQRGEAIIDFFVADQDGLRRACFDEPRERIEEAGAFGSKVQWVDCDPNDPDVEWCGEF